MPDPSVPGPYQVRLDPFGRRYEGNEANGPDFTTVASADVLRFDGFGPNWPAAVYLPTTAPVRSSAPEYADGERAGPAACEHVERGIVSTNADWATILTGDFVLCSGSLRDGLARIHFDESSLTLLRADGTVILEQSYDEPIAALIRGARFQYPPELDWWVEASRSPLKLWISESSDTRLNVAIFSALP